MENKQRPIAGIDYLPTFNEFDRFNRRTSRLRGLLFYRLNGTGAVVTAPTSYRNIVDMNYNI